MSSHNIVFFDDYPLASENKLFLMLLRKQVEPIGVHVIQEKTIKRVEEQAQAIPLVALILDIISEVPRDFRSVEDGSIVPSALAGVELLRRCRAGEYGETNRQVPIFMRTTRGEPHIRTLCGQLGATGYFQVGIEDKQLIEKIVSHINHE
jgi:CheY-like chemotaxis protein